MADKQVAIDEILKALFTNGAGEEADRLLLIKESQSGAAGVTNGEYLGGYNKAAVRSILDAAISAAKENEG